MNLPSGRKPLTQARPSTSIIPNLPVEPEVRRRIRQVILTTLGVGRDDEADMAVCAAQNAAAWYVNARYYETQLPVLRRMILSGKGGLRDAVQALLDLLPTTSAPVPFAQIRSLFCYGDPSANGNEQEPFEGMGKEERKAVLAAMFEREDTWNQKFGPEVIRPALERWLTLMNDLGEWVPPTKAMKMAEMSFVSSLHSFWALELCLVAENTRTNGKQAGAFADFVRAAAEIIPQSNVPGRQQNWDHQLRRVLEGESPK
jgi:hypothetical protein